jgi:hypothetical protein
MGQMLTLNICYASVGGTKLLIHSLNTGVRKPFVGMAFDMA